MRSLFGYLATGLAVIGAINWGLVGLFNINPVHQLTGHSRGVERAVYSLVGLAGLFLGSIVARSLTSPTYEEERMLRG
jgi:uncharacterized protein